MSRYQNFSDDFYINLNLNTEMDLPKGRETVLHFFEQLQRRYPSMRNFYTREKNEFVLEEDKDDGRYRWATIEARRICAGQVNPNSVEQALELHRQIMDSVPYALSMSPLDCESINVMFGFDFTYHGNHNQLVAEALGIIPAFDSFMQASGGRAVSFEPAIQIALDDDCRIQCRLSVETRTSAFHLRTGQFPEEQLSVYVTARRYGSLDANETYVDALNHLATICQEVVDDHVQDNVLRPLQQAIAMR
jgi:hypothetical protein